MQSLTDAQQNVLDTILRHFAETANAPTIRELCSRLGIASPNGMKCHLDALTRKGVLESSVPGQSRGIMPVGLRPVIRNAVNTYRKEQRKCRT